MGENAVLRGRMVLRGGEGGEDIKSGEDSGDSARKIGLC